MCDIENKIEVVTEDVTMKLDAEKRPREEEKVEATTETMEPSAKKAKVDDDVNTQEEELETDTVESGEATENSADASETPADETENPADATEAPAEATETTAEGETEAPAEEPVEA